MKGYRLAVLRFTNDEVRDNIDAVVERIRCALIDRLKQHK